MIGLTVLIPIAVAMGLVALLGFFWALRTGQYEDLEGASQRILDEAPPDELNPSGRATRPGRGSPRSDDPARR